MNIGETFRNQFLHMVDTVGDTILIHKNWNMPSQTTLEIRGLKNSPDGRPKETVFQLPEDPGIALGDVIQQKGSRDLWRVTEVHDDITDDVFQFFEACVVNMTSSPRVPRSMSGHSVHVQGPVYGGIQIDSHGSVQHNNVHISNVDNDIHQIRNLFAASELSSLDKEEAALALGRISDLAKKQQSPDVLAKISAKIEELKGLATNVTALTSTAMPLLVGLWERFQHASH